jgi:EmrB/QacA subfamily drug resistance transporter
MSSAEAVLESSEAPEARRPSEDPGFALSRRRRLAITIGVMTGSFIAALEGTVVSTAMPTVVASLGGIERFSWVFSGYMLTSTVTVPLWGKLSDLYGRRRLYQAGVLLFLVGSVLSGLATTMTQLIVFRTVQGLGAGALIPLGMTIVGEIYSLEERARMQGYFSGVWGLASIVGPVVGGYITEYLSWRWVFFINVPFGLAAAAIIGFALVERARTVKPTIDYAGAITLMVALSLALLGLVEAGSDLGPTHPLTISALVGAVVLGALFLRIERRALEPIVPLDLFRDKMFGAASLSGFLIGVAMFGAIAFIPLYVQGVTGASATEAGSVLSPLLLSWVTMSIVGGRLLGHVGVRSIVLAGISLVGLGFAALGLFDLSAHRGWLMFDMAVLGSGMGLAMLTLLIGVQATAPKGKLGIATSFQMFTRSIGGAVGVAIMGAVLSYTLGAKLDALSTTTVDGAVAKATADPNAMLDPELRASVPPGILASMQDALGDGLRNAFGLGTIAVLLAFVAAIRLPREKLIGRK